MTTPYETIPARVDTRETERPRHLTSPTHSGRAAHTQCERPFAQRHYALLRPRVSAPQMSSTTTAPAIAINHDWIEKNSS